MSIQVVDEAYQFYITTLMRRYRVTCLECGESDILSIDEINNVVGNTERKLATNFKSYRWRGDGNWGFQCFCGNDNRVAVSEKKDFDKLVAGDPISVQKIVDSLKIPDRTQFRMEAM